MLSQKLLGEKWTHISDRLKDHWTELSDYELHQAKGSPEQLIGVVHQRTGASPEEVEEFLRGLLEEQSAIGQAGEAAAQYANQVTETAARQLQHATDAAGNLGEEIATAVRRRPIESVAIAFGLGVVTSATLFLVARR